MVRACFKNIVCIKNYFDAEYDEERFPKMVDRQRKGKWRQVEIMNIDFEYIKTLIHSNEINQIVTMCRQLEQQELCIVEEQLIKELQSTDNGGYRNTTAIILSDLKCDRAVKVLVDLIDAPQNKNNRGTLIYALEGLKCENEIKGLIHLIFDGNYEVKWSMYHLLSEKFKYMSEADRSECINILSTGKRKLEETLDILEDLEENVLGYET